MTDFISRNQQHRSGDADARPMPTGDAGVSAETAGTLAAPTAPAIAPATGPAPTDKRAKHGQKDEDEALADQQLAMASPVAAQAPADGAAPTAGAPAQSSSKSDDGGTASRSSVLVPLALGGAATLGAVAVAAGTAGGHGKGNHVPVANPDTASATEGGSIVNGSVATNDTDKDAKDVLSYSLNAPVAGLTLNANGTYSFDPGNAAYNNLAAGQTRSVVATYTVDDGHGGTASSTLTITVTGTNDAPVAVADAYSTLRNTPLTVAAAQGVLANDSDPDGNSLTAALVSGPAHGTLTLNANGSFAYTPAAGYTGPDSFTYRPNDGTANGNTVTVNLAVAAPPNSPPVSAADSYSTNEDTTLTVNAANGVLANDSDAEGNPLTAALVAGPAHGSLTLNANGSFSYTPSANYSGPDSFAYRANDGTANGNTVTVSLTVNPVNDPPVSTADAYSAVEDTLLAVTAANGVLANDSDPDGNPLTAILVSTVSHGSLTLNANGSFTYMPAANYNGPDSFTYKTNDGSVDGNIVTVSLNVAAVNDLPVSGNDSYSAVEDTILAVNAASGVLANDSDPDGNALTAVLVAGPAHGALTLNADGSFSYAPATNYNGPDSFTYRASDGTGNGNVATVTLNVAPASDAPVAAADAYSTNEDSALTVSAAAGVLANDSDADGNPLAAVLVSNVSHGNLSLNADGSFSYTPAPNYHGPDSFTYKVNDGTADGNTVTVQLTVNPVNDAPTATGDSYTATQDTPLTVTAASGVLANDSDVDGDALSAVLVSSVAHGSLTLSPDGGFTYTPAAGYTGPDSFTYRPNDGNADGNVVTVSLNVAPPSIPPVASPDSYSTNEDTPLSVTTAAGVLANDTDADGDPLTAILVAGPAHGTLTLNPDGSFNYSPAGNYNGPDSFTYKANDGTVDGNTVTVSLTVNAVNDAPVAFADNYSTAEDSALIVAAPGVLANDADADGNPLIAVLVSGPAHGSLSLNPDGSFSYTPNPNYNGADSFTYKPNDGLADGNIVTVSLTVTPVNDAPVATADSYNAVQDTALTVAAATGVLANDSDADGNPLTAALVSDVAHGTLALNANGSFTYTPAAGYTGPDSFTYKVNDGTVDGNSVTVSLNVLPSDQPPIATADSYATNEDSPLVVNAASGVLANDSDPDGDPLTAILVSGTAHGSLALNPDGSFSYTPAANYSGPDSFTYKVNDGTLDGNTVTVNLTVNPVNDAPTAVADSYSTAEDTPLAVAAPGVLANDSDIEGSSITAVLVAGPAHASAFTLNANGSFNYTPAANYNGPDSFTYRANDGTANGNIVTVSLNVTPVNDAPVSLADAYSTNEDVTLNIAAAAGVLANDSDVDGNPLTAALVSGPAHGSLTLNPNGSFAYTPTANYNGADSFTYRANDGSVDGNTVTVNLTVNPVNDPPVANDDVATAGEDSALTVSAAAGVLSNDTDIEGSSLSVVSVNGSGSGVGSQITLASGALLTLNANGSYVYNPNGQFEALRPGQTATDSFTYSASDGTASDAATVTITIQGANEVPTAAADTYNGVTGNTPFTVAAAQGVLANDTDPDQPASGLSVTQVNGAPIGAPVAVTGGTVTMNANGSFTFVPATGFQGAASFSYTVTDADGGTDIENVTINVTGQVWYVDAAYAGANGPSDGSYLKPFTSLTELNGVTGDGTTNDDVDAANDTIFVYNSGTYNGGIVLEAGQKLFGDSHTLVVNGITVGANASNSTINHAAAGITLASGNTVDGFDLVGTAAGAVGIQDGNASIGTASISGTSITGQGQILDIDQGGTLNATFTTLGSSGSTGANGGVIDLTGIGGTLTVSGATTINGTHAQGGLDLTGNTSLTAIFQGLTTVNTGANAAVNLGANVTSATSFTGGLDIDTTSGTGFAALAGSSLTISGAGNTVNTTTGQILALNGATVAAGNLAFAALAASGTVANSAISINNLDGGSFSGGTVSIAGTSGAASDGIFIGGGSTTNFSFGATAIGATGDEGIEINGAGNGTVAFTSATINGSAGNGVEINGATSSVTISGGAIGSTDDPAGDAVNITGGTAAVTIAASIAKTTAGNAVEVNNHDSGNISLSGNISASGTNSTGILVTGSNGGTIAFTGPTINLSTGTANAVDLTSNSGATINFNPAAGGNGLDIATTSGTGFNASGGGTINLTGSGNTIAASAGKAIDIDNATIGMTWSSLSSSGANEGVGLTNLLAGSSFNGGTVTISSRTGTGVFVDSAQGTLTFGAVTVANPTNAGGDGIHIEDSSASVTIASATVSNTRETVEQTDANTDFIPDNDGDGNGIFLRNVTGGFTLNGGTISNSGNDGIDIRSSQNITINGVTISNPGLDGLDAEGSGKGGHGIEAIQVTGAFNLTNTTITDFEKNGRDGLRWLNTTGTGTLTITGSTFSNSEAGSNAIFISARGNSTMNAVIGGPTNNAATNNNFLNLFGAAITHNVGDDAGSTATSSITIQNNLFQGTPATGGQNSVSSRNLEGGHDTVLITGNTFENVGNTVSDTSGVIDIGGDGLLAGNSLSATITNNIIHNVGSTALSPGGATLIGKRAIDVFIDDNTNVVGPILISGNTISDVFRSGIYFDVGTVFNGANFTAKITNNTIGTVAEPVGIGTALNSAGEWGVRIENRNSNGHNLNILVSGNSIVNANGGAGSQLNTPGLQIRAQNTATLDATVLNNNITTNTSDTSVPEMSFQTTGPAGGTPTLSVDASGNTLAGGAGRIILVEALGDLNVEQASLAALASANGIPAGNATITTGSPDFGVPNAAAPMLLAHSADPLPGEVLTPPGAPAASGPVQPLPGEVLTPPGPPAASGPVGPLPGEVLTPPAARSTSGTVETLTQPDADNLLAAAIARWALAGATPDQIAAMGATTLVVADMAGGQLGSSGPGWIQLDDDGAGRGWFVDPTPGDDAEFVAHGAGLNAISGSAADGRVDLLTVLMHELGHQVGLADEHDPSAPNSLMNGELDVGVRLTLGGSGQLAGANAGHQDQSWISAVAPLIELGPRDGLLDKLPAMIAERHAGRAVEASAGDSLGQHAFAGAMFDPGDRGEFHGFALAQAEQRPFDEYHHPVL